jgi:hypothetical protein
MLATQNYQTSLAGFTPDARRPFGGYFVPHLVPRIAGIVLAVKMCEESEVSELRYVVSNAASHRKGYVSSFSNFSDAGVIGQDDQTIGQGDQISAR